MNANVTEAAVRYHAANVSDAQLVAAVLGTKESDAMRVLEEAGGLHNLLRRPDRKDLPSIGTARSLRLAAALELARRAEAHDEKRIQVCSPQDVADVYGPRLRDLKQEIFLVVLLNTANVITGEYIVSEGGLSASIVEPRTVFQKAIMDSAAAIVVIHNHPSQNPEPSREDIRVTRQLVEAGKILQIPLHDHVIIAGKGYTSLAERSLL